MSGMRARLARRPPGYRVSLGRVFAIYSGLMLVTVLAALDQTIVATATPSIVADIGGLPEYSWVFTAYMLASAVTIPLYGKLGDVHGRRRILLVAISIFVAGSILCGLAPSMPALIVFRAIQGIGAGGLIPMSTATIASIVPLRERGKFDGFIGLGYASGSILGPLVGGLLVDHATWRWIFFVNVPVGILALTVIVATVPSLGERIAHVLDWKGAALLGVGTGALLLAFVWAGRNYGWGDPHVLTALAVALVAGTAFIPVERRAPEPIIPLDLLRNGPIMASLVCVGFGGLVMFGAIAYVPLYVQGAMGVTATLSGLALIPMMLGHAGASTATGFWIARTGRLRPNAIGGAAVLVVGTLLLWRLTVDSTVGQVARDMVVAGRRDRADEPGLPAERPERHSAADARHRVGARAVLARARRQRRRRDARNDRQPEPAAREQADEQRLDGRADRNRPGRAGPRPASGVHRDDCGRARRPRRRGVGHPRDPALAVGRRGASLDLSARAGARSSSEESVDSEIT